MRRSLFISHALANCHFQKLPKLNKKIWFEADCVAHHKYPVPDYNDNDHVVKGDNFLIAEKK